MTSNIVKPGLFSQTGARPTATVAAAAPVAEDPAAEMARLRAEIEALKAKAAHKATLSLKVSEKGAISIYGLGRFPVTLYRQQAQRLAALFVPRNGGPSVMDEFIAENTARLSVKE